MQYEFDSEKIYNSCNLGPFKIINLENISGRKFATIKFINTGTEKIVRYDIAISGHVLDELYDIDFNKIYYSINYGPFRILSYEGRDGIEGRKLVKIKFINTGFEDIVTYKLAKIGRVKDKSGVSRVSEIPLDQYDQYILKTLETRWKAMMSRCYNLQDNHYCDYGALGVSVCDQWHDFENYKNTISLVKYYDKFYKNPANYTFN